MDEDRIQRGTLAALNQYAANPEKLTEQAMSLVGRAIGADAEDLSELQRKLDDVSAQQSAVLDRLLDDMTNVELNERLRELTEEKRTLTERMESAQSAALRQSNQSARLRELADWLEKQPKELTEYDDAIVRRMTERITVVDADTLRVRIRDTDVEIEASLPARARGGRKVEEQ
jgi:predicted nuclease with TOPRIM domain